MNKKIQLKNWKFQIGESADCLKISREVTIPHTWNIEEGTEEYWGIGWYEYTWEVPKDWEERRVRISFKAVYHDAEVYLNGVQIGEHKNSGFTPFSLELTKALKFGEENKLTVKVDNSFTESMLPYMRSFDWANDGGIIRDVELIITGKHFLEGVHFITNPVLLQEDIRQEEGEALFGIHANVNGSLEEDLELTWELYKGYYEFSEKIEEGSIPVHTHALEATSHKINGIQYWHFDSPALYTVRLTLKCKGVIEDVIESSIGFREFVVKGNGFYLNGERVRICGTEWMPGSDPAYGMAEPKEQLEKMMVSLKESNCVYTRFHWQQDEFLFDWCDRHGMLMQEEIPFWGKSSVVAGELQWETFCQQAKEMIEAHRNHPSIIAWGVGNELDGQAEETIAYIKKAVEFIHDLDDTRMANYVSNTFYKDASLDGTVYGDALMINDYIGTWAGERDQFAELDKVVAANPDKPLIPAEFGLCEPFFAGGDKKREAIFLEKMEAYRKYPCIAGTINFSLNDYRTQMGEDGAGKYRQRIHGSVGLTGEKKPSYYVVQRECSPLDIKWKGIKLTIACKTDLPSYEVKNYFFLVLDSSGNTIGKEVIPNLKPGMVWEKEAEQGAKLAIYRPNGDYTGTYEREEGK